MVNLPTPRVTYRIPLFFAVLLHLLVIAALCLNLPKDQFRWPQKQSSKPVVNAVAVNAKSVSDQIKQIKWEQQAKERKARMRLQKIEQQTLSASRARRTEQKRVKQLQLHQAALAKQTAQRQRAARQKLLNEQQKIKKMHEQALAEQQKKLQEQLAAQQMKDEQQQIKREQQQLAKVHATQLKGVLDKYRAQILQSIQQTWHPLTQNKALKCQWLVHVAPGGVVTGVDLIKSSGSEVLDRSARLAILKASPLPVPQDASLFDRFRQFRISMSPQDIKGIS